MDFEAWTARAEWRLVAYVLPYVAAAVLLVAFRLRFHGKRLAAPKSIWRYGELLVMGVPLLFGFGYAAYNASFVLPGILWSGTTAWLEVAQLGALLCFIALVVLPLVFSGTAARRRVEAFFKRVSLVEETARDSANFTDDDWRRAQIRSDWSAYKDNTSLLLSKWRAEQAQPYMLQSMLARWLFGKRVSRRTFKEFVEELKRRADLVREMQRQESA